MKSEVTSPQMKQKENRQEMLRKLHMRRKNKVCTGTPSIKSEIHKN